MIRLSKNGGSCSSSIYMTDEEEEEDRQVSRRYREDMDVKVVLGKRKKDNEVVKESSDSETEERRARKEKRKQQETERIMDDIKRHNERNEKPEEESEMIVTTDQDEEDGENFENTIKRIQERILKINKAVSKESYGKIAVTRADQQQVKDSAAGLLNDLVGIVLTQIKMERRLKELELEDIKKEENIKKLKKELNSVEKLKGLEREGKRSGKGEEKGRGRMVSDDSDSEPKRSYADVSRMNAERKAEWQAVKKGKKTGISGRVIKPGKEGWTTPPLAQKRAAEAALIIKNSKKDEPVKILVEKVTKAVNVKDIGGPPKAVRTIRDGRMVIVGKDGEQITKIRECLGKIEGVETNLRKRALPLIRISGVEKGLTDTELEGKIRHGEGITGEIKIIRRITCRNPWKENVIIQTGPADFKAIVKRGKVELDCALYFAEEYLGVSMCFRCCRFGHIMKGCSEKEACYRCMGAHDARECKAKDEKCINCWRMFGRASGHHARDSACPAFQKTLERSRQNLNYSG